MTIFRSKGSDMFWEISGSVDSRVILPRIEQSFSVKDANWNYSPEGHGGRLTEFVRTAHGILTIGRRQKILNTLEMLLNRGRRVEVPSPEESVCFAWFSYQTEDKSRECCFFLGLTDSDWDDACQELRLACAEGQRVSISAGGMLARDDQSTETGWPTAEQFELGEALGLFNVRLSLEKVSQ